MEQARKPNKVRRGSIYLHIPTGRPCRVQELSAQEAKVKFHKQGFVWDAESAEIRTPEGKVVPFDESREYAVVKIEDLAVASAEQVRLYLGK